MTRNKTFKTVWALLILAFAFATLTTLSFALAVVFAIMCAGMSSITVAVWMEHRAERRDEIDRARAYTDRIGFVTNSQWAATAVARLERAHDSGLHIDYSRTIGRYLANDPMAATEIGIITRAVALTGAPPQPVGNPQASVWTRSESAQYRKHREASMALSVALGTATHTGPIYRDCADNS